MEATNIYKYLKMTNFWYQITHIFMSKSKNSSLCKTYSLNPTLLSTFHQFVTEMIPKGRKTWFCEGRISRILVCSFTENFSAWSFFSPLFHTVFSKCVAFTKYLLKMRERIPVISSPVWKNEKFTAMQFFSRQINL